MLPNSLVYVGAQVTVSPLVGTPGPTSSLPPTCLSRSINYITHSLPQQCLASPRVGKLEEIAPEKSATDNHRTLNSVTAVIGEGDHTTFIHSLTDLGLKTSETTITLTETSQPSSQSLRTSAMTSDTQPPIEPASSSAEAVSDTESDSPLDNANFLSFEEWKKQNLAKAGQLAENVGSGRRASIDPKRRHAGINNALDSLGEDAEIEIDFGGFVSSEAATQPISSTGRSPADQKPIQTSKSTDGRYSERPSSSRTRSKDAGKTCKERSNYASFDCAATVLKTNSESKGATYVLLENKDSYMLNECAAKNKFFIVELCDNILIDTIVLANYEFFSSIFRTFRVSVSDKYPVRIDKWRDLGEFEARNAREVQAFLVEEPQIWARYLRIEFLTHFGNEYYCPVSLLRVHGTTMMEEFNHELKSLRGEDDNESDIVEEEEQQESESKSESESGAPIIVTESPKKTSQPTETQPSHFTSRATVDQDVAPQATKTVLKDSASDTQSTSSGLSWTAFNSSISARLEEIIAIHSTYDCACKLDENLQESDSTHSSSSTTDDTVIAPLPTSRQVVEAEYSVSASSSSNDSTQSTNSTVKPTSTSQSSLNTRPADEKVLSLKATDSTSLSASKSQSSPTHPPAPNPTTQESFFKSVHKRLQLLESNSTLSLQYIEEQSRILRDAFTKVEKRQLTKTATFLDSLNKTVLTELREFRTQYDQIWQSTVLELSSQRQQSQSEISALSARLSLLADELLFQKRIAILQFLLILLCLGLVLFSRGSATAGVNYLEHMVQKSSVNLSRYAANFESPSGSPPSTRPSSRYGIFGRGSSHQRSPSEESVTIDRNGTKRPNIEYSPPTPTSQQSEGRDTPGEESIYNGLKSKSGAQVSKHATAEGYLRPNEYTSGNDAIDGSTMDDHSCDDSVTWLSS
ncbi:MAG: hypothetical protein LQ351_003694 [Letrouitia transgressa]|nr:MAG: hypothetical protein LQ351_003694 [Letrouitia transgressa]